MSLVAIGSYRARDRVDSEQPQQTGPAARLARIDALVDALSSSERAAVSADIAAALAQLRHRGFISSEFIARAESAELGHLAIALSTKRDKRPTT